MPLRERLPVPRIEGVISFASVLLDEFGEIGHRGQWSDSGRMLVFNLFPYAPLLLLFCGIQSVETDAICQPVLLFQICILLQEFVLNFFLFAKVTAKKLRIGVRVAVKSIGEIRELRQTFRFGGNCLLLNDLFLQMRECILWLVRGRRCFRI